MQWFVYAQPPNHDSDANNAIKYSGIISSDNPDPETRFEAIHEEIPVENGTADCKESSSS